MWNCDHTDQRGSLLEDLILELDLQILNAPGQQSTHREGHNIDVTLCKGPISQYITDWRVDEYASISDHRLILFEIQLVKIPPEYKFQIKGANYDCFNLDLCNSLASTYPPEDLDERAELFQHILERSCDRTLKHKTRRTKISPWWNNDLSQLRIRALKSRRRVLRCCPCPYRQILRTAARRNERTYKNRVRFYKLESWKEFLKSTSEEDPYGLAYKLGVGKATPLNAWCSLRSSNGMMTNNMEETITALQDEILPVDTMLGETEVHERYRNLLTDTYETFTEPDFTISELRDALGKAKNKRAPGMDRIPSEILKNLSLPNLHTLLNIYNDLWREGRFPRVWKHAKMIFIYKGKGKDPSDPKSYRPISLLSTLSKTFERLIAGRLTPFLELENRLSSHQHGFRPNKSTNTAIRELIDIINNCTTKHAVVVFMDISGAFDGIWWPYIMGQFRQRQVATNIYKIMESYLSERFATTIIGEASKVRELTRGCPQGGVFGPKVWDVSADEIIIQDVDCDSVAFADDIAYVLRADSRAGIEAAWIRVEEKITNWAHTAKLNFSHSKCKALHVRGTLRGRNPIIRIDNEIIEFVDSVKYLGITLDKKLLYIEHAKTIASSSVNTFASIVRFSKLKYGASTRSHSILYKTVFVPTVCYAEQIWYHRANHSHIKRALRGAQCKVLRKLSGAYITTPYLALTVLMGHPPIDLMLKERARLRNRKEGRELATANAIKTDTINKWQEEWNDANVGLKTRDIFPQVGILPKHITVDHVSVQFLTGHGSFRKYFYERRMVDNPNCPTCNVPEDVSHALLECRNTDTTQLMEIVRSENIPNDDLKAIILNEKAYPYLKEIMKTVKIRNSDVTKTNLSGITGTIL